MVFQRRHPPYMTNFMKKSKVSKQNFSVNIKKYWSNFLMEIHNQIILTCDVLLLKIKLGNISAVYAHRQTEPDN